MSAIAGLAAGYPLPLTVGPQWLMAVVLFPVVNSLVAFIDKVRLLPLMRL